MSRIGKKPIPMPKGVTFNVQGDVVTVKGPKGTVTNHLPAGVKDYCVNLSRSYTGQDLHDAVESFASLKILVLGDTIFDRYSYVKVQGLTSKNRMISGRYLREEMQCGGALAVFRHVKQFAPNARRAK